jgi:predicted porin
MTRTSNRTIRIALGALWVALASPALASDDMLERLEALIRQQSRLIEAQGRRLEQQDRRLASQERRMQALAAKVRSLRGGRRTVLFGQDEPQNTVASGSKAVRLAISGQIHRALNVVDDGHGSDLYHVDSDTSNSRVRFVGSARINEDLSVGTNIEVAISPNNSGAVDQKNQRADDTFDQRVTDLFLESEDWGRLTIGKGYTASDGTAEVDLSGTSLVAYSGWSGIAGGIRFFDDASRTLTNVTIANGFGNRDGLGRENRISYESPRFFGLQLAGGANANDRYDGALRWSGRGYGFKAAAAGGFADFGNRNDPNFRISGSASALHEATGLNLTLAGGMDERGRDSDATHGYVKLGLLRDFFDIGDTALAVDFTRTLNLPTRDDDGYALGGILVQQFERLGAEIYSQFRWIELDRKGPFDLEEINIGTAGVRVKF